MYHCFNLLVLSTHIVMYSIKPRSRVSIPGKQNKFFSTMKSTQPPTQRTEGALSLGVKWPRRPNDNYRQSIIEGTNESIRYVQSVICLPVMHRNNFTSHTKILDHITFGSNWLQIISPLYKYRTERHLLPEKHGAV